MASSDFPGVPLPAPSKIGWAWGISDNRKRIPKPHMGFYWGMPSQALCLFSAPKVERSFRHFDPRPRLCFAWDDSQVHTMVGILRGRQQTAMAHQALLRPYIWEDLYYYFDTVDLWRMGAWNLWRVLHRMCDEAEGIVVSPPLGQYERDVIEEWAYDWCTHEKNRDSLRRWNETSDILSIMSPMDIKNVRWCERQALDFLRGVLKYWHGLYKVPEPTATQAAKDDIAQVSPQFAPSEGRPRRRSNSLPPAPPNDAQGTAGFVYTANPAIVIVNGTTAAPPKPRGLAQGQGSLADGVAGGAARKGHHPSKSGPLPAVAAGSSVAARGAGVEGSGPSRLPKAALRPADAADTTGRRVPCCRGWRRHGHNQTASFVFCACHRCMVASRSVFVAPIRLTDNVGTEQMRGILAEFFARWGHVQGCELKISNPPPHGGRAAHFAFVRFDSQASAVNAVAEAGGEPLDASHLVGARVSHPHGSNNINRVQQTHTGSSGIQQSVAVQGHSAPRSGAQEKKENDGDPGPSNCQHPSEQQQQPRELQQAERPQQPQRPHQQLATTHRSPDDARNSSHSTSGPAMPPPTIRPAPNAGNLGAALPSGQHQLPPRPPSEYWGNSPPQNAPWFPQHMDGGYPPFYRPIPPSTQMRMPHDTCEVQWDEDDRVMDGWDEASMWPSGRLMHHPPPHMPPSYPHHGHPAGFPHPDQHFPAPHTPHGYGPHFHGHRSQPRVYPSRTRPSAANNIPAFATQPASHNKGTSAQTRQHSGNETSKQTSPPAGIETTVQEKPPVSNEAQTKTNPTPKMEMSIQTKRPSDEAVFEDEGLQPTRPSTAHSTTSSMNIRIRLPSVFANPAGEESSLAPEASKVGEESPTPDSPRVNLPPREKIPDSSPVRRITFGDFGPPDAMPPVLQRTQPPSPTPQPRAQSTVPSQSSMLVNVSEREFSQGPDRRKPNFASDRNPGDIRLEEDYTGTVIRRPPRGNAGRLPWNEQHDTGGYPQQGFRRGHPPAPPPHGPSGTFYPPPIDVRSSFNGPAHHSNDTPTRPFRGQPHQSFRGPQQAFNGPAHHSNGSPPQPFHGPQQAFNGPRHHSNDSPPQPFHGPQQAFNGLPHHSNGTPPRPFNGKPHQPFHGPQQSKAPPHHGPHHPSFNGPQQSFNGPPHQSFHGPHPPPSSGPPPFHSQYPQYSSPIHGPAPNLPHHPFQSGAQGPSPPQGFNNSLRSPPYQQPPPQFPQFPQPALFSPPAARPSTAPQPTPSDRTDWHKSSKWQKKRKARANNQARYALALQAQSRGPSPLPPLPSATASEAGTDQASVATSTKGKGKGRWKGKGKAKARPATPAGSEFVGEDDVYNATPRKAGETSMPEGDGGGDQVKKGGEGSSTQDASHGQGQGASTQGHPHARPPSRVGKPSSGGDNKDVQDKDTTTTNKKKGGNGPSRKKKAPPLPPPGDNNDAPPARPSNKPAQDPSNKPEHDSDKKLEQDANKAPATTNEPAPAEPAGEPASSTEPAPSSTTELAQGSSSTPGYRANAGGSLHVQRHRRFGSKPAKRGDVRDLFTDVSEE